MAAGHYIQQGISLFALYLPLLVAFVLAFRVLGFFDLSLAGAAVLVAYTVTMFANFMPSLAAIFVALILNALCGIALCTFVYLYFIERKTPSSQMLIVSLGIMSIISACIALVWGQQSFAINVFHDFTFIYGSMCMLSLILLFLVVRYSKWGIWLRVLIDNRSLAEDVGVPVVPLTIATEGICFFLAGITGIGEGVFTYVIPSINFASFVVIIGAALLGAFSFSKSVVALAVLVIIQTLGIAFVNTAFASLLMYGSIFVILVVFYSKPMVVAA